MSNITGSRHGDQRGSRDVVGELESKITAS
jgi:hypothetical protein